MEEKMIQTWHVHKVVRRGADESFYDQAKFFKLADAEEYAAKLPGEKVIKLVEEPESSQHEAHKGAYCLGEGVEVGGRT